MTETPRFEMATGYETSIVATATRTFPSHQSLLTLFMSLWVSAVFMALMVD